MVLSTHFCRLSNMLYSRQDGRFEGNGCRNGQIPTGQPAGNMQISPESFSGIGQDLSPPTKRIRSLFNDQQPVRFAH